MSPKLYVGDARFVIGYVGDASVDCIVTSPPYYKQRDYGIDCQLGQEASPSAYVEALLDVMDQWQRVLRPGGSVFLNIADSAHKGEWLSIPAALERGSRRRGWHVKRHFIWAKTRGRPEPGEWRFAPRWEHVYQLVDRLEDAPSVAEAEPDVWWFDQEPTKHAHIAPYPLKLAESCILLGSEPGGTVLDPFCGSGTTLLAAWVMKRRAVGLEANPEYAEITKDKLRSVGVELAVVRPTEWVEVGG